MPTGYTADIEKGISFKQYALSCARAFGACIEMRDDPADKPIPEKFEASDYHEKQLAEANKKIVKLKAMTLEACQKESKAEYEKAVEHHKAGIKKDAALKSKYEAMLAEVEAWVSPSAEHDEFKNFMREQIVSSIKFDCGGNYHHDALKNLKPLSGDEWRAKQIDGALKDISYAAKNQKEENERAAGRTKWVRLLRESL
jgi:hypothetical protein